MASSLDRVLKPRQYNQKYLLIILVWSGLVIASLAYNFSSLAKSTYNLASSAAIATVNKDISFRKWATSHGGVYVPPTERAPSNPYLIHPERDVVTSSGIELTLMNPAYMLRDMQRHFGDDYGTRTNITSLNPLNPNNIPDPWEIKVLKGFETNPTQAQEISLIDGEPFMRVMLPFYVEPACLKCHSHQGYEVGQVRGGIGTSVPMQPFLNQQIRHQFEMMLSHGLVWLVGLGGFIFGWRRELKLDAERVRSEKALEENEALYRSVTNNGQALIWLADLDKNCTFFNQPWLNFTGRALEQEIGTGWTKGVHPEDIDYCLRTFRDAFDQHENFEMVYRLKRHDGQYRWILDEGAPRYNSAGEFAGYIGHCLDVTELREAKTEVEFLAHFDPLTHMPNRRLIQDYIQQALEASEQSEQYGALILVDIDNFKLLNDTLGHEVGDQMLKQVAARLRGLFKNKAQLGRFGGDEFMILIDLLTDDEHIAAEQAEVYSRKVLSQLRLPFNLQSQEYQTTSSIGIMLFKGTERPVEELLRNAELAMYQAKETGRNNVRFFDPHMQLKVSARTELEHDLRRALNEQQFVLYLQPQVNQQTEIMGAEALIRWQHPERGMVAPNDFIPLAEETGLILPIGDWVLAQACQILDDWSKQPQLNALTLAVNVSARQFYQADFVDKVSALVQPHYASRLKLELTESLFVLGIEQVMQKMNQLKQLGIQFSLDDFGTGYSSLSYLKRLPLNQLKIDQSFVRDLKLDENDQAIARMVIALSSTLELNVIAEGVETLEQKALLEAMGCVHFQGYLFGRPQPREDFENRVKSIT